MDVWYKDYIALYKNALDPNWCDAVINYFERNISSSRTREQENVGYNHKYVQDLSVVLKDKNLGEYFQKTILNNLCPEYFSKYPHIPVSDFLIPPPKIQKTYPSEGYHMWHSEWQQVPSKEINEANKDVVNRFLAYTIYLNDVEEGGETEFLYQSLRLPPSKGTVCFFPSFFTHIHRGNPPLKGIKYILTGWFISNN